MPTLHSVDTCIIPGGSCDPYTTVAHACHALVSKRPCRAPCRYNALRFFSQNAGRLALSTGTKFVPDAGAADSSTNAMDRWVVAAVQGLIKFVRAEMEAYRLYTVVPRLVKFIRALTNWYVRLNRRRLKGLEGDADGRVALSTLYFVLMDAARLMSPFTPFLTEFMYQHLRTFWPPPAPGAAAPAPTDVGHAASIHYTVIPEYDPRRIDTAMEARVERMQEVIELGRIARERRTISLKTPVREVVVVCADATALAEVTALGDYVKDELNSLELVTSTDEGAWATLVANPEGATLGKKLGKAFKDVQNAAKLLTQAELAAFLVSGTITLAGHTLTTADLKVTREVRPDKAANYEALVSADGAVIVAVNTTQDDALRGMGAAREVVNRVQKLRKKLELNLSDSITIYYRASALSEAEFAAAAAAGDADEDDLGGAGGAREAAANGGAGKPGSGAASGTPAGGKAGAKGGKGAAGKAGATAAADTSAARDAAVASLHAAIAANTALIKATVRYNILPDLPGVSRPAWEVVLGEDSDVVASARLHVLITRAAARLPPTNDALVAAVTASAARVGVALTPASDTGAASASPAGASAAPAPPTAAGIARTAVNVLLAREYNRMVAELSSSGGRVTLRVDGVPLTLESGVHFYTSPDAQLRDAVHRDAWLAAYRSAGGDAAARLAQAYASQ